MDTRIIYSLAAGDSSTMMYAMFAGALGVVAYAVYNLTTDLKTSDQRRLADRLREGPRPQARDKEAAAREAMIRKRFYGETSPLDQFLGRFGLVTAIQRLIDQADLTWLATHLLLGQVVVAAVAAAGLLITEFTPVITIGVPVGVLLVPIMFLNWKRRRRRMALMLQLPDVFELMSQALRAGHGLASAIQVVAQQMPAPIGTEFARVYHEQNLGINVEESLKNMGDRVAILDIRFFVTAVMIQRTTGGDLAEVLDKISKVIRGRIELFGHVDALTAEGRLSGWVLLALPPLVFCASWRSNPAYAEMLIYHETGKLLTYAALGMMVLNYVMIRKIVNIKV